MIKWNKECPKNVFAAKEEILLIWKEINDEILTKGMNESS